MKCTHPNNAGFTLLEVLAALVVLAFVVAGLSQGLRFGLRATERQERLSAERGDVDAVDRLLRRLVEQADPGTSRDPYGLTGDGERFTFVTALGPAMGGMPGNGAAEVGLGVEGQKLVLTWRPISHTVAFDAAPPPGRLTLADGIERIEVRYWGGDGSAPPVWRTAWQGPVLPVLIRVRLVFRQPARHWPDIVAGPARPRSWS